MLAEEFIRAPENDGQSVGAQSSADSIYVGRLYEAKTDEHAAGPPLSARSSNGTDSARPRAWDQAEKSRGTRPLVAGRPRNRDLPVLSGGWRPGSGRPVRQKRVHQAERC